MAELYPPYEVYRMINKAMLYRGGVLDNEPEPQNNVINQLNTKGYITVNGQRTDADVRGAAIIIYVIIAPNYKYSSKSQDFKKLLKLVAPKRTVTGTRVELIFISEVDEKIFKNADSIEDVKKLAQLNIHMYGYEYRHFKSEKPVYKGGPSYEIMSNDEVQELCDKFLISTDKFPILPTTDVISIWYGFRPGNIVRINMSSDTAGEAIIYAQCK